MKQIAIVSGKGGTGKTTIAAAFAELASHKIVADCDVEAPNLHLVLEHQIQQEKLFQGNRCAFIDTEICNTCGRCQEVCRYHAVKRIDGNNGMEQNATMTESRAIQQSPSWHVKEHALELRASIPPVQQQYPQNGLAAIVPTGDYRIEHRYSIDPKRCEGCAACVYACPAQAIQLRLEDTGKIFLSETPVGKFAHAELFLAADGSGKLVSEVRRVAQEEGLREDKMIIIDGSPGIGCVVISTITGCQAVLVVTEPTQSGKHDLERVLKITQHFRVPALVAINKWDLNPDVVVEIEGLCQAQGVDVAGKIPFDPMVPKAIAESKPVTQYNCPAAHEIRMLWNRVQSMVNN